LGTANSENFVIHCLHRSDTAHECDRQTDRQTDGRTDRQTPRRWSRRAMHSAIGCKK